MNAYFKQALATGTSTKQNKKTGIAERSATTDLMNQDDVQTHGFRNFSEFSIHEFHEKHRKPSRGLHKRNKNRIKSSKVTLVYVLKTECVITYGHTIVRAPHPV